MKPMPPLPKKRNRTEAKYDGEVAKWFEKNYDHSVALEVKVKGGSLKPHQIVALKQVSRGTFSYKIPDQGQRNPFDYVVLQGADAFIVIVDPKTRKCIAKDPATGSVQFEFKI